jgi:hypothetical protein
MSISNLVLDKNSYPICQRMNKKFLEKSFEKGSNKVQHIAMLIKELDKYKNSKEIREKYKDINELRQQCKKIDALKEDLLVYALHYLVKGAKIPILNQDKHAHVSYLEFISDSDPKYYRSQGGSICKLYMKLLEKGPYQFLFTPYENTQLKDVVQPIKNKKFRQYLKLQYNYKTLDGITPLKNRGEQGFLTSVEHYTPQVDAENEFLDISKLLDPTSKDKVKPADLQARIAKVKAAIRKNPNDLSKVTIGGFVTLEDGQSVYILLQDGKIKETRLSKTDREKLINAEAEHVKENRAHSGYFPDIIDIRKKVLKYQGFSEDTLLELYPNKLQKKNGITPVELSKCESSKLELKFKSLELQLIRVSKSSTNPCVQHYCNLFSKFLGHLKKSDLKNSEINKSLVMNSLLQMEKIINRISILSRKDDSVYTEFLSEIDLLTEEVVLLLAIIKPFETTSIEETLDSQGVQLHGTTYAKKSSYVFSSGMNGFAQVFSALQSEGRQHGEKLKIGYSTTNYFELRGLVIPHLKQSFEPDDAAVNPYEPITKDYDVFFMDLYPNEVTLDTVKRVDPNLVIDGLLAKRNGKPLTVVIDTSTTIFSSQDMQDIVDRYKDEIDTGLLNIVVVNSLAKFSMCGLDKYTGGVVQTYNNPQAFWAFNDKLDKRKSVEKLSPEAERFFYLFFRYGHENIDQYLATVNRNTEILYQKLVPELQAKPSAISLSQRNSDRIPMLSFKFDSFVNNLISHNKLPEEYAIDAQANLASLMQYYIYALAKAEGLPMDCRLSFGFAHANINECWIALRLTVGLENPELLEKYKKILIKANKELEACAGTPALLNLIKQQEGFYEGRFKNVQARENILKGVTKKDSSLLSFLENVEKNFNMPHQSGTVRLS